MWSKRKYSPRATYCRSAHRRRRRRHRQRGHSLLPYTQDSDAISLYTESMQLDHP